jgi:hypothetical protein
MFATDKNQMHTDKYGKRISRRGAKARRRKSPSILSAFAPLRKTFFCIFICVHLISICGQNVFSSF